MDTDVNGYIERSDQWPEEITRLRQVLLGKDLTEQIKWGKPCYSHGDTNLAIIQEMNAFLALMFFKGALMEDPAGVLVAQGPNSRSAKRIEFTSIDDVERLAETVADYIDEAIRVEREGLEVGPAPEPDLVAELRERLDSDAELRAGFEALTPGRRREYNMYFSDAKQASTRARRVDKYAQRIRDGVGMRDRPVDS